MMRSRNAFSKADVPILREVLDALGFQPIETGVYDWACMASSL